MKDAPVACPNTTNTIAMPLAMSIHSNRFVIIFLLLIFFTVSYSSQSKATTISSEFPLPISLKQLEVISDDAQITVLYRSIHPRR